MSRKEQQLNGVESEVPFSCQDNKLEAETVSNGFETASRDKELSVTSPVDSSSKDLGVSSPCIDINLGVDICTGLPKLPIEPIVDSEEEPETPCLTVSSWNFNPKSGYLTGVMSNVLSSNSSGNKTVSFKEDKKESKGMDHSQKSSSYAKVALGKCPSDSQLPHRGEGYRRSMPGTQTLERFRRSRSVIRLKRSTSSLHHKGSIFEAEPLLPPSAELQRERQNLNTKSEDVTDRASTTEGVQDHHDDQEAPSPIEDESRWLSEIGRVILVEGVVDIPNSDVVNQLGQGVVSQLEGKLGPRKTKHMSLPVPSPDRQYLGRRSSFLYHSDSEDLEDVSTTRRGPSQSSSGHMGDETYVTPFAQILATLHRMRSQYMTLTGMPEDTKTPHSRPEWSTTATAASPNLTSDKQFSLNTHTKDRCLALEILEELDWCLKKLETVSSTKSMGNMAKDKFRRLLNRELSHLSEGSRRGAQVAEWVTNMTNIDADVDRALDTVHNHPPSTPNSFDMSLTESLGHHDWVSMQKRTSTTSSASYDRIPVYGVESDKMDTVLMRGYASGAKLLDWNVDVFTFSSATGDNPLLCSSYIIFNQRKLFSSMNIRPQTFVNFMGAIQGLYHDNPYHNAIHATDVLLSSNMLLNSKALEGVFTDLEVLATLVAAAVHDVNHPGVNNQYLVSIRHNLATLYNDSSVLENHHLATAFTTLQKKDCNILESFENEKILAFRRMVIDMVLATDMAKHLGNLAEVKTLVETKKVANNGILVLDEYSDRMSVLQILLHCADLSNPTKTEAFAVEWTQRIIEELFRQGDKERDLKMPIQPGADRNNTCIPSFQISFIDFIIFPLWETWAELVYPDAQDILDNITAVKDFWTAKNEESNPPSEEDTSPRSSRTSSSETAADLDDKSPPANGSSNSGGSSSQGTSQSSPTKRSPTKSPQKKLRNRRLVSATSGEYRNSMDLNKSKLSGSLTIHPSSGSLMAIAEREARGSWKPMTTTSGSHFSGQCEESTRNKSWSADSGLNDMAARDRRSSFKSAKQLPIAPELISSVDP